MKTRLRFLLPLVAAAGLSLVGCMIGKTTHTLVLETDGTLTWTVEESQMRSSEDAPADRRDEEREWLADREAEIHGPAEGLWQIGARTVETLVLRDRRPFHAVTTASFDDPGDAVRRLLEAAGIVAEIDATRTANGGSIAIRVDIEATEAAEELARARGDEDEDRPVDTLLDGDELLVMVADGAFVASVGFDVEDDIARFDEDAIELALERDPRTLRLYLEWELF